MYKVTGSLLLSIVSIAWSAQVRAQPIPPETPRGMLAAQIRVQGFACDKALGAKMNKKRSRADRDVWVLRCSNATYRVTRSPDMAAKVEPLP
jgi:hypothetical protein